MCKDSRPLVSPHLLPSVSSQNCHSPSFCPPLCLPALISISSSSPPLLITLPSHPPHHPPLPSSSPSPPILLITLPSPSSPSPSLPSQLAYLENLRSDKLHRSSVMIQKNVKAWLQRRKYLRFRQAAIFVQNRARGCLIRRMVEGMRRTNAATVIQKWYRCHYTQRHYQQLRRGVMFLQRRLRGHLGRVHYRAAVMDHRATVIQSRIRGWLARVEYRRALQRVVKVQSCVRRWLAARELKRLKVCGWSTSRWGVVGGV